MLDRKAVVSAARYASVSCARRLRCMHATVRIVRSSLQVRSGFRCGFRRTELSSRGKNPRFSARVGVRGVKNSARSAAGAARGFTTGAGNKNGKEPYTERQGRNPGRLVEHHAYQPHLDPQRAAVAQAFTRSRPLLCCRAGKWRSPDGPMAASRFGRGEAVVAGGRKHVRMFRRNPGCRHRDIGDSARNPGVGEGGRRAGQAPGPGVLRLSWAGRLQSVADQSEDRRAARALPVPLAEGVSRRRALALANAWIGA